MGMWLSGLAMVVAMGMAMVVAVSVMPAGGLALRGGLGKVNPFVPER